MQKRLFSVFLLQKDAKVEAKQQWRLAQRDWRERERLKEVEAQPRSDILRSMEYIQTLES